MHATFLPASETGGDTYDLALVDQGLLVVLGDATGHGIAPALLVMQFHAMLRMALRMGAGLEDAFRHVNDQLAETLHGGRFVTAFIGLLDADSHRLRFISGGQGPILHYHAASRRFDIHGSSSFPMGAMALPGPRPAHDIDFAPGDLLVLLTDGIFEYEAPDGEAFGCARVEQLVAAQGHRPPDEIAACLIDAVRAFARGAPQEDDITAVLLQRNA
jgi:phosphoserine phosphatase